MGLDKFWRFTIWVSLAVLVSLPCGSGCKNTKRHTLSSKSFLAPQVAKYNSKTGYVSKNLVKEFASTNPEAQPVNPGDQLFAIDLLGSNLDILHEVYRLPAEKDENGNLVPGKIPVYDSDLTALSSITPMGRLDDSHLLIFERDSRTMLTVDLMKRNSLKLNPDIKESVFNKVMNKEMLTDIFNPKVDKPSIGITTRLSNGWILASETNLKSLFAIREDPTGEIGPWLGPKLVANQIISQRKMLEQLNGMFLADIKQVSFRQFMELERRDGTHLNYLRGGHTEIDVSDRPAGSESVAVVGGDFDDDGYPDLVVANKASNNVSMFRGGKEGLTWISEFETGSEPVALASADFDGDGFLDVAVANQASNNVTFLRGGGLRGCLTRVGEIQAGSEPVALASGDFDNDGFQDVVVANRASNNVTFLRGEIYKEEENKFGLRRVGEIQVGSEPVAVTSGYFDSDGFQDVAVANRASNDVTYLRGGKDNLIRVGEIQVGSEPVALVSGTIDDGPQDVVVANRSSENVTFLRGGDNLSRVGEIQVGKEPVALIIDDLNNDGYQDIVVANKASNNVTVLRGGTTGLSRMGEIQVGSEPVALATGDFNGDSLQDVVVANRASNNLTLLRGGAGGLSRVDEVKAGEGPRALILGDFDSDGFSDTMVINSDQTDITFVVAVPSTDALAKETKVELILLRIWPSMDRTVKFDPQPTEVKDEVLNLTGELIFPECKAFLTSQQISDQTSNSVVDLTEIQMIKVPGKSQFLTFDRSEFSSSFLTIDYDPTYLVTKATVFVNKEELLGAIPEINRVGETFQGQFAFTKTFHPDPYREPSDPKYKPLILAFDETTNNLIALDYSKGPKDSEKIANFTSSTMLSQRIDLKFDPEFDSTIVEPAITFAQDQIFDNMLSFDNGSGELLSFNFQTGQVVVVAHKRDLTKITQPDVTGSSLLNIPYMAPIDPPPNGKANEIMLFDIESASYLLLRVQYRPFPVNLPRK